MYNVSDNFKTFIKQPSRILSSKVFIREIEYLDEYIIDINLEETVNPDDGFVLGSTASNKIELTLVNISGVIFEGAVVKPYIGLDINGIIEYIPLGIFTVDAISKNKDTIKLTCFDNMIKTEKAYFSDLTYPTNIHSVAQEICTKAGVALSGILPTLQVNKPEGYTIREAISYIASFLGGFARFNRIGQLEFVTYASSSVEITGDNYFKYETGEKAFAISKLSCKVDDETVLTVGTIGNEVQFENPLMTQTQLNSIYNTLKTLSYMPYTMEWQGNPALMAGDKITIIDINNNTYSTLLMEQKLSYKGGLRATASAKAKTDIATEFSNSGTMTQKMERYSIEQANIRLLLAEKATIIDLQAETARINNLYATSATIIDLTAATARIDTLEATTATITQLNAVDAKITNLTVSTAMIEDLSVTNAKVANAAINTANIIDAAITNAKIANLSVDAAKIVNATITTAKIANAQITTALIADAQITTAKIANLAVDTAKIKDATITTAKIADAQITNAKIANATIEGAKIANATIGTAQIALGAITTALIANAAIGTTQIADASITDGKIVGLTASKITAGTIDAGVINVVNLNAANITVGTINGQQIASGAISVDKLSSGVQDSISNAQATADGKNTIYYQTSQPSLTGNTVDDIWFDTDDGNRIYRWNGTAWVAAQFGTGAIANLAITNALIADATIASAKISALDAAKITTGYLAAARIQVGSLNADKLIANSITAAQIAASTITALQIAADTITGDKLVINTITAREIAASTITATQMVAGTITAASSIIADAAITNAKIANVDAIKITTGILSADRIGANTITTAKLLVSNPNLISDVDSFEQYSGKEPPGSKGSLTTCIVTDEEAYHGLYALKTISSAVNSYKYLCPTVNSNTGWVKLDAGKRYIISVYVKTTNATATNAQIVFVPREGKTSTSVSGAVTVTGSISITSGWTRISGLSGVIGGTNPYATFYVRNAEAGTTIYWDAIQVEEYVTGNTSPSQFGTGGAVIIDGGNIVANTVTANQIAAGTITAASAILADAVITTAKIADAAITDAKIASLNATKITSGYISADRIQAGTIDATKLNVTSLSAISADLGTVTAGTINGVTINSSTFNSLFSGDTVEMTYSGGMTLDEDSLEISQTNLMKNWGPYNEYILGASYRIDGINYTHANSGMGGGNYAFHRDGLEWLDNPGGGGTTWVDAGIALVYDQTGANYADMKIYARAGGKIVLDAESTKVSGVLRVKNSGSHNAIVQASATAGEYLFGGSPVDDGSLESYVRVGNNRLQYKNTSGTYNIGHSGGTDIPFALQNWINDSQSLPRIYLGDSTNASNQILFRASNDSGTFQLRNAANATKFAVNMGTGELTIGTVPSSKVSGLTNEVTSTGSNSNGTYIKYTSGIMIQYGTKEYLPPNAIYHRNTISLPTSFYDNTYVVNMTGGDTDSTGYNLNRDVTTTLRDYSKSVSSFVVKIHTESDAHIGVSVNWIAFGRWKA